MDGPLPISLASAGCNSLFAGLFAAPSFLLGFALSAAQKSTPSSEHIARLVQSIQVMPWLIHAGIAAAFVIGLVLWLRGKPLLKPTIVLLAAVVGGLLGFILLPVLAPSATVPPWLGMLTGALAGSLLMLAMHRVLAAAVFGAVLAVAMATVTAGTLTILNRNQPAPGIASRTLAATATDSGPERPASEPSNPDPLLPLAATNPAIFAPNSPSRTATGGEEQPIRSSSPEVPQPTQPQIKQPARKVLTPATTPSRQSNANPSRLGGEEPSPLDQPDAPKRNPATNAPARPTLPPPDRQVNSDSKSARSGGTFDPQALQDSAAVASSARNLWSASQDRWQDRWADVPAAHRIYIIAAAVIGAVGGTLAGIIQPAWAAAVLSAIAGSGIAMFTGIWLAHATGVPGHNRINLSAVDFSVVWLTLALIGIAAQWRFISSGTPAKGGKKKPRKPAAEED